MQIEKRRSQCPGAHQHLEVRKKELAGGPWEKEFGEGS
jgi:hypothetical protein